MTVHLIDSCVYGDALGTAELRALLDESRLYQKWLDVEAALAAAQAEMGMIPRGAAEAIRRHARIEEVGIEPIAADIRVSGHTILGLIRALRARLPETARRWVHYGTTTQDVVDTGTALYVRDALGPVFRDLRATLSRLLVLAGRHAATAMAARTHGIHALPFTFGLKVAGWAGELERNLYRLEAARRGALVGNMTGAVGTFATWGRRGPALQRRVMRHLGLGVPEVCWHSARDRFASLMNELALTGGGLARIAKEVYLLSKTETGELEEPFPPGKTGSSTMPHKRNPFLCEWAIINGRALRYNAGEMMELLAQEHERDATRWKGEWRLLPESLLLLGGLAAGTKRILSGLRVDKKRMRANLDMLGPLLISERISFALGEKIGLDRSHHLVYEVSMEAFERGAPLLDLLLARKEVAAVFGRADLERLCDPIDYLGESEREARKAVAAIRKRGMHRSRAGEGPPGGGRRRAARRG